MPDLDLAALRRVADAATQSEWEADLDVHGETRGIWPDGPGQEIIIGAYVAADGYDTNCWAGGTDENLTYIATFDPPTVKALLDRLEAAERGLDPERLEVVNGWLVERGAYPPDYSAGAAYGAQPYSDAEPLLNLSKLNGWTEATEARLVVDEVTVTLAEEAYEAERERLAADRARTPDEQSVDHDRAMRAALTAALGGTDE